MRICLTATNCAVHMASISAPLSQGLLGLVFIHSWDQGFGADLGVLWLPSWVYNKNCFPNFELLPMADNVSHVEIALPIAKWASMFELMHNEDRIS